MVSSDVPPPEDAGLSGVSSPWSLSRREAVGRRESVVLRKVAPLIFETQMLTNTVLGPGTRSVCDGWG